MSVELGPLRDNHRELGKISKAYEEDWRQDGGKPNTIWVTMDFNGSGQGFGGYALTDRDALNAFWAGLMAAFGVAKKEDLEGQEAYALRAFGTWNDPIIGLESKKTGRKFTIKGFRKQMGYPGGEKSAYEEEIERIQRDIEFHQRRIAEDQAQLKTLKSKYVEWD